MQVVLALLSWGVASVTRTVVPGGSGDTGANAKVGVVSTVNVAAALAPLVLVTVTV